MVSQTLLNYLGPRQNYNFIYHETNESIEAITSALEVKGNDQVLSICASGAQPLALLENLSENGELIAIDNNPEQIKWTNMILTVFKNKDKKEIKELNLAPREQEYQKADYFLRENRLNKINTNLKRINFRLMDVIEKPRLKTKFTKGYFSNAPVQLPNFYSAFEPGALIYTVFSSRFLPNEPYFFMNVQSELWGNEFKSQFELDLEKTKTACDLEKKFPDAGWTPAVFRRL